MDRGSSGGQDRQQQVLRQLIEELEYEPNDEDGWIAESMLVRLCLVAIADVDFWQQPEQLPEAESLATQLITVYTESGSHSGFHEGVAYYHAGALRTLVQGLHETAGG